MPTPDDYCAVATAVHGEDSIEAFESCDPPTYDGEPVSPKSESPREQLRRSCIDLTRLADALGWTWSLESCDAGGFWWKYEIVVDGPKEGDR